MAADAIFSLSAEEGEGDDVDSLLNSSDKSSRRSWRAIGAHRGGHGISRAAKGKWLSSGLRAKA
jgi:hypothetical protein